MSFVNINGEPIDIRAQMEAGARLRHLERQAGVVHRKPTVKSGYAAPPGTGPDDGDPLAHYRDQLQRLISAASRDGVILFVGPEQVAQAVRRPEAAA